MTLFTRAMLSSQRLIPCNSNCKSSPYCNNGQIFAAYVLILYLLPGNLSLINTNICTDRVYFYPKRAKTFYDNATMIVFARYSLPKISYIKTWKQKLQRKMNIDRHPQKYMFKKYKLHDREIVKQNFCSELFIHFQYFSKLRWINNTLRTVFLNFLCFYFLQKNLSLTITGMHFSVKDKFHWSSVGKKKHFFKFKWPGVCWW